MLSGTSRLAFFAPSIMVTDTEGLSAQPSSMVNSHCMSSVPSLCVAPLLPAWVMLLVQVVLLTMQGIQREGCVFLDITTAALLLSIETAILHHNPLRAWEVLIPQHL